MKQQNAIKELYTIASMREIEQHLDRSFHWFLETVSRIKESDTPKEELDELSKDVEDKDASIFATKRQVSQADRKHSESAGLRSGRSHRSHHSSSPSTRSEGSNSSCTKKKAAIIGLEAKRKAMLETQKEKVNLADIQTELELVAEKLMNEAQ